MSIDRRQFLGLLSTFVLAGFLPRWLWAQAASEELSWRVDAPREPLGSQEPRALSSTQREAWLSSADFWDYELSDGL